MWAAIIGLIGAGIGLWSSSKSSKSAAKMVEEQTKALASYAGLGDKEIDTLRAKRDSLLSRQKYLVKQLIDLIYIAGKKRWIDELQELEARQKTEDYATEIKNLIHTGIFGGSYAKKFVTESRKFTNEFNINARDLRAINATIDNKLLEEKDQTVDTSSWSASIKNFLQTGELGTQGPLVIIGGILLLVIIFKKR